MGNGDGEKIVARFRDGRLVKGLVRGFSIESDTVVLNDQKTLQEIRVPMAELKAIFFVKNFGGSSKHVERKAFGIRKNPGKKVQGFFLTPVDADSNNNKVFVVAGAIQDITIIV